jgi:hypothetical protein
MSDCGLNVLTDWSSIWGVKVFQYSPVVLTLNKREASELEGILNQLVDECDSVGATKGSRYRIFSNVLKKVRKQRKNPVMFFTN